MKAINRGTALAPTQSPSPARLRRDGNSLDSSSEPSQQSALIPPQSGHLAQLSGLVNRSSQVQAQLRLAEELQNGSHVLEESFPAVEVPAAPSVAAQMMKEASVRKPEASIALKCNLSETEMASASSALLPAGAPVQMIGTPLWKKLLIGTGMVAGAAGAIAGGVVGSPLLAAGGLALAAGSSYAAYREWQKPKPILDFIASRDTFDGLQRAAQGDPNIQFDPQTLRITSSYDAQQLIEQYSGEWKLHMETQIDERPDIGNRRRIPQEARLRRKIDAAFSLPGEFERKEQERAGLLRRTTNRVNDFDYGALDQLRTPRTIAADRQALGQAGITGPGGLLSRHSGVVLGEDHGDPVHKQYIADNLGQLTASGVTTLYMEHFRDDYQKLIDQYLASGPRGTMPPELRRYVDAQDRQHNAGQSRLYNILVAAKAHGVRVRGIDTQAALSPDGGGQGGTVIRDAAMNKFGEETIHRDARARGAGKYVILTGYAHSNTQPATEYGEQLGLHRGTPGFSQLLGIPAVRMGEQGFYLDEEERGNR